MILLLQHHLELGFFKCILNMKQAGVVRCTYFASMEEKMRITYSVEEKPQTFGCPPVPASGRNVFVLV